MCRDLHLSTRAHLSATIIGVLLSSVTGLHCLPLHVSVLPFSLTAHLPATHFQLSSSLSVQVPSPSEMVTGNLFEGSKNDSFFILNMDCGVCIQTNGAA